MSLKLRRPAFRPFALLLLIVCIVRPWLPLGAQTPSISGSVTDSNGAVLPGITITLVEPESRQQRMVITNDEGQFSLLAPPRDSARLFILLVDAPGFAQMERTIELPQTDSASPFNFDLILRPASLVSEPIATEYIVAEDSSSKLVAIGGTPSVRMPRNQKEFYKLLDLLGSAELSKLMEGRASVPSWWVNPLDEARSMPSVPRGDLSSYLPVISIIRRDYNGLTTRAVIDAKPQTLVQNKTGILYFANTQTAVVRHEPDRFALPWLHRWLGLVAPSALAARSVAERVIRQAIDASHETGLVIQPAGNRAADASTPGVKLFFVDTGQSSGASIRMTIVNEGSKPVTVVGGAFVLEPVQGISERDVTREIARLKGRKSVTVTIDAYCLNMRKPPPDAGTVMRLVPKPAAAVLTPVQKIASAARVLYDAQQIQPDSDPLQYRHALLQWAIWTQEQQFTEQTFTQAFIDHSRQNIEGAGRRWTPALDAALRKLAPGRWRDIRRVFRLARLPMVGDAQ
jgi:hypothetical protein